MPLKIVGEPDDRRHARPCGDACLVLRRPLRTRNRRTRSFCATHTLSKSGSIDFPRRVTSRSAAAIAAVGIKAATTRVISSFGVTDATIERSSS